MSDLGTLIYRVLDELPRNTSSDEDRIKLAAIDAIKYWRTTPLFFNEITDQFTVTIGEEAYGDVASEGAGAGYDNTLLGINCLYADDAGGHFEPVEQWPLDIVRLQNTNTTSIRGYPDFFAFFNKQIYVSPVPHVAYDIRIDGIKDIGTPVAQASAGTLQFFEPDGTTALTDAYTSEWFTEAEELIRLEIKINLAENVFRDFGLANILRSRRTDVFNKVQDRKRAFRHNSRVIPYEAY